MGIIKKILDRELVGGSTNEEIYPISSTKAIYNEKNENLDNILSSYLRNIESLYARQGFYICDSDSIEPDKEIQINNFTLSTTIRLLVKMTKANIADNVSFEINNTGAYPLYYNDAPAASNNTWEEGEVLDIYFDGLYFKSFSANTKDEEQTDSFWELKTDKNGLQYIYTKFPIIGAKGLSIYSSEDVLVPSIFEGIPIDNDTIYWDENEEGIRILKAKGSGGSIADIQITGEGNAITSVSITDEGKSLTFTKGTTFATSTDLANKWTTDNDKIASWDSAASKAHEHANKATLDKIYEKDGVIYWDGSLAVTGGITAYAIDGVDVSTIMDGIACDNTTIRVNPDTKVLEVIGELGGGIDSVSTTGIGNAITGASLSEDGNSITFTKDETFATTTQLSTKWTADYDKIDKWDTAATKAHTHDNKTILDGISEDTVTNWNTAFSWGNHANAGYAHLANEEEFTGLKHFIAGLSVGTSKKSIYEEDGVVYIDADVAITGGVTAYALGNKDISTIMDGVTVDEVTLTKGTDNVIRIKNAGSGSSFDEDAMWSALSSETTQQISKSHLATALTGYATLTDVDDRIDDLVNGAPAAFDTLKEIADVLQGNVDSIGDIINTLGTKWTQDNTKISNWDDAYNKRHTHDNKTVLDGIEDTDITNWNTAYTNNHTHSNKTVLDGINSTLVTNWNTAYKNNHTHTNKTVLDGITSTKVTHWDTAYGWGNHADAGYAHLANEETFSGLKHFTSGLSIGENKHKIYEQDGNIILDGNLLVTGGITAYSDGTSSGGSGGGIDVEVLWQILGGTGTQQINVAHLTDALTWDNVSNKPTAFTPSAHTHVISDITSLSTELDKKVSSVTVTGTGNAITSASIANGVLTLTKGATYNNYSLPLASSTVRGGVKIGYTENGRNYPVELSNEQMFVNVPWTDTKYTLSSFGITATATEINKLDGATITTTELNYLDGVTSNVQTQLNNSFKEAYLQWGGKNFAGSYGCIDAAMIPDLGSNRLAFMPADSIEVQYSRDGGETWSDYPTSDTAKLNFFNGNGASHVIGANSSTGIDKSNYRLRFIITTNVAKVYTILNKFCIYCSTNGSSGSWCTIDAKTKSNVDAGNDTWTVFANKVPISGWSGYNIINTSGITTYGNQSYHFQKLRFTFGVSSHLSTSKYSGLSVYKIYGFGGVGWTTPSNMARYGRIYSYDSQQNVTFPGSITATEFSGLVGGYTASRALVSNSSGKIAVSAVTSTELGYLDGVTSNIQTQLNSKLNSSSYTASDILTKLKTVHGANSGLDADLLDGVQGSEIFRKEGLSVQNLDANNLSTPNIQYYPIGDMNTWGNTSFANFPTSKPAGGFTLVTLREGNYLRQFYTNYLDRHLYQRYTYYGGKPVWSDWYTVASTIDNVESATKLQTARSIWSQSFNGEAPVDGLFVQNLNNLWLSPSRLQIGRTDGGIYNDRAVIGVTDGNLHIDSYPDKALYFNFYSSGTGTASKALVLSKDGNVGIGTQEPLHKLHVVGTAHASRFVSGFDSGNDNAFSCSNWFRSSGNSGWLNQTYWGGIYMEDSTWVRVFNNRSFYCSAEIRSGSRISIAGNESNDIDTSYRNNGTITNMGGQLYAIKHSINFKWYGTEWYIGNIRSASVESMGFGVANGNTCYLRVNTDATVVYSNFLTTGGITCYSSDQRAKTVLEHIDLKLKDIANAPTIRFKWNDWKIKDDGKTHIGGIAQYMQKLLPETVLEADGALNMDYATTGYIFAVQTARHLQTYETRTDKELRRLKKRVLYLEQQLKKLGYEEADIISD